MRTYIQTMLPAYQPTHQPRAYQCRSAPWEEAVGVVRPVLNQALRPPAPPEKLANLTVTPSMVYASVRWAIHGDGGSPITHFTLVYQQVLQIRVSSLAHNLDSEAVSKSLDAEHHRSTHLPIHISPAAVSQSPPFISL